jgi:hypothetical protein
VSRREQEREREKESERGGVRGGEPVREGEGEVAREKGRRGREKE